MDMGGVSHEGTAGRRIRASRSARQVNGGHGPERLASTPVTSPRPDDREPTPLRRLLRGLALSFASISAVVLLGASAVAASGRAWTWVQLGLCGVAVLVAASVALAVRRPRVRGLALAVAVLALL